MVAPNVFLAEYENAGYLELLKLKNELVQSIAEFENDFEQKNLDWDVCPSPDVHYQWNLEVLGILAPMLQTAFNEEYESGKKDLSDFYREVREIK